MAHMQIHRPAAAPAHNILKSDKNNCIWGGLLGGIVSNEQLSSSQCDRYAAVDKKVNLDHL